MASETECMSVSVAPEKQKSLDIASGKNAQFHSSDDVGAMINKFKV